jgi:tRNA threonylcarbamoyladenosine biosynthesis protein TsaB
MIDARRMECYTAFYNRQGEVRPVDADIIVPGIYDTYLEKGEVVFLGDGAEKTRDILGIHPNAKYAPDFQISAAGMLPIALKKLQDNQLEDVAYFEPYYLKDFVAKKSVVRGLR